MAGPNYVLDKGFPVGAAVRQFRCVELHATAGTVTEVNAGTDVTIGVAQEAVTAADFTANPDRVIGVRLMGISRCIAGAAIAAAGVEVMSDAEGRVINATATNRIVGIALNTTAAAGEHVDVLLTNGGIV